MFCVIRCLTSSIPRIFGVPGFGGLLSKVSHEAMNNAEPESSL